MFKELSRSFSGAQNRRISQSNMVSSQAERTGRDKK
jgi:hypothetical protein